MTPVARHLQGARTLRRPPPEVVAQLRADVARLAERATATAVTTAAARLPDHHFREPPAPRIATEVHDTGTAVVTISWNDDRHLWPTVGGFAFGPTSNWHHREEEDTGWPTLILDVVVSPAERGTTLTLLSSRAPGVDPTSNRIDKQTRDALARQAVDGFLDALVEHLEATPALTA